MNIFIDESGAFSWHNRGRSLFAGLTVPDRNLGALSQRFEKWRRSIIGHSSRELKGKELTDSQLQSFTNYVLPLRDHDTRVTVVGADTSRTSETIVATVRDQVSKQFALSGELVRRENPSNKFLTQFYSEMSGWVKNRSAPNFLWISVLEVAILDTLQHSAVYYMEPDDDAEFENIEILIDRSFIRRDRHLWFWREWLRNALLGRSHKEQGFAVPHTWAERGHPFLRKYGEDGLFDFRDLFQNHMRFEDSKKVSGLQIADICAHICYRHWRAAGQLEAYRLLRPRVVGKHGAEIHIVQFDERSVIHDGIENHVNVFDHEALRKEAAARQRRHRRERAIASSR